MPTPAIEISDETRYNDGVNYTVECDVTYKGETKEFSLTTHGGYASNFMLTIKAYSMFYDGPTL